MSTTRIDGWTVTMGERWATAARTEAPGAADIAMGTDTLSVVIERGDSRPAVPIPLAVLRAMLAAVEPDRLDRESLGRRVREVWVAFAQTQPNPKPHHLLGWDELDEDNKEVDRQIGETIAREALATMAPVEVEGAITRRMAELAGRMVSRRKVAAALERLRGGDVAGAGEMLEKALAGGDGQ